MHHPPHSPPFASLGLLERPIYISVTFVLSYSRQENTEQIVPPEILPYHARSRCVPYCVARRFLYVRADTIQDYCCCSRKVKPGDILEFILFQLSRSRRVCNVRPPELPHVKPVSSA